MALPMPDLEGAVADRAVTHGIAIEAPRCVGIREVEGSVRADQLGPHSPRDRLERGVDVLDPTMATDDDHGIEVCL